MSDVVQLMRAANPVPDSEAALPNDEFDALLLLTQSRSRNVDVQELTKPVEPEKTQRSGWLVAAAAFAVVIVAIGAAMLLSSPADELPPATTPPTTQALTPTTEASPSTTVAAELPPPEVIAPQVDAAAAAFVEAMISELNGGDFVAAGARVASSEAFPSTPSPDSLADDIANRFHLWVEMESVLTVEECLTPSSGTTRCEISRLSKHEPFSPLPETSFIQVRLNGDHPAFFNLDQIESDAWFTEWNKFEEWMCFADQDDCRLVLSYLEPVLVAQRMKELVPLWRATLDE